MIACSTVQKHDIRSHYDMSTLFYRLLWGPHIHHGLWLEDELVANSAANVESSAATAHRNVGNRSGDPARRKRVGCRLRNGILIDPSGGKTAMRSHGRDD